MLCRVFFLRLVMNIVCRRPLLRVFNQHAINEESEKLAASSIVHLHDVTLNYAYPGESVSGSLFLVLWKPTARE